VLLLAVLDFAIYPVKTIGDLFLIEVLGCRVPLVFFGNILTLFFVSFWKANYVSEEEMRRSSIQNNICMQRWR
jgi:hypothetical protein